MSKARKICVVTGSRADYGHLSPVMHAIKNAPDLLLQVIVCGQHLSPLFGNTEEVVSEDGFTIDARVEMELASDTPLAVSEATGIAIAGLASEIDKLRPDIVVILGDRFEILAAGIASLLLNVPIAHIHGGEITEAAVDDAIRHSLTKMASLHFAAAESYAVRICQMGEEPARVFVTGAPGLDLLDTMTFLSKEELASELNIDLGERFILATYHPVTLTPDISAIGMTALIEALEAFPNASIIFTGVNSDPGHAALTEKLLRFTRSNPKLRKAVTSLGSLRYLSALKSADVVIGNSSSGLIEAPALGTPSVNIGDRQKGRLRSSSVIDCKPDAASIRLAIDKSFDQDFRATIIDQTAAYGFVGASEKIVSILKTVQLDTLRVKHFHDLPTSVAAQTEY